MLTLKYKIRYFNKVRVLKQLASTAPARRLLFLPYIIFLSSSSRENESLFHPFPRVPNVNLSFSPATTSCQVPSKKWVIQTPCLNRLLGVPKRKKFKSNVLKVIGREFRDFVRGQGLTSKNPPIKAHFRGGWEILQSPLPPVSGDLKPSGNSSLILKPFTLIVISHRALCRAFSLSVPSQATPAVDHIQLCKKPSQKAPQRTFLAKASHKMRRSKGSFQPQGKSTPKPEVWAWWTPPGLNLKGIEPGHKCPSWAALMTGAKPSCTFGFLKPKRVKTPVIKNDSHGFLRLLDPFFSTTFCPLTTGAGAPWTALATTAQARGRPPRKKDVFHRVKGALCSLEA